MKKLFTAAALITSLSCMGSAQASLIVDNFNNVLNPNGYQQVKGFESNTTYRLLNTGLTGVIGGERLLEVFDVDGGVEDFEEGVMQVNANAGTISFTNDAQVTSKSRVSWNGLDQGGIGGVFGSDITEGGSNEVFIIDVALSDSNVNMLFSVTDASGNIATRNLVANNAGMLDFFFQDFTNFASTDFTAVRFLSLELTGPQAADTAFNFVEANAALPVPEPTSIFLLGLGLIGLRRVLK
jgi:hypothetical protein